MLLLRVLYIFATIWLSIYGFNAFVLIVLYWRHRKQRVETPAMAHFPPVTVQLPLYNEKYVARRAIDALARLDWPREKLQIQVLDDSTDETTEIAHQCIKEYREKGLDIVMVHRSCRAGFKAGALNAAMEAARGEFVAIFDADFCPPPDFLSRTVPHLAADAELGFVQARWGHLNDRFSALTLAQAVALDGHFVVEHVARQRSGLLTNFSGTGGVWRRACIEACGGWRPEMLTEDIDLSYRAQLAGWKGLVLPGVVAPAELPVQITAFKRQQFRWAKGNIQCFLRQTNLLIGSSLSLWAKLQGLIHLSYYLAHPLMVFVMLCMLPLIWLGPVASWSLAFLSLATLGPPLLYLVAQRDAYPDWRARLRALPVLIALGTGMALNSTVAIIEAFLGVRTAFLRTPKFQVEGKRRDWQPGTYLLVPDRLVWGEISMAIYACLTVWAALVRGNGWVIPFVLLYVLGFGYVGLLGVLEAWGHAGRWARRRTAEAGKRRLVPFSEP